MGDPSWMGGNKATRKSHPASPLPALPHEPVHFKVVSGIGGDKIDCLFYPAKDYFEPTSKRLCYVFGHGGADHQRAKWVKELVQRVVARGYSMATLDFRGNGESTGVTTYSNHELESHDMHALIRSITSSDAATRPIPHPVTILAIGGHSKGGIAALFHVRNYPSSSPDEVINASSLFFQQGDPEDKTFFRIGMWAEIKKIGKMTTSKYRHLGKLHDYFITDEDIYTREKMDIGELTLQCANLKPSFHLAAVTGSADQIAPPKDMEHYKKYVKPGCVAVKVIPDAGHTFKSGWEVEMLAKNLADSLDDARGRYLARHGAKL